MEVADFLIRQQGVAVDSKNDAGETPLHVCVNGGNTRMALWLLEHKASVNVPDSSRTTPLHKAVVAGSTPMVQLLLERGAAVDSANVHGETPLHVAVRRGKGGDIVTLLLKAKAQVNLSTRAGQTVLDILDGLSVGDLAIRDLLTNAGAKNGVGSVSVSKRWRVD